MLQSFQLVATMRKMLDLVDKLGDLPLLLWQGLLHLLLLRVVKVVLGHPAQRDNLTIPIKGPKQSLDFPGQQVYRESSLFQFSSELRPG